MSGTVSESEKYLFINRHLFDAHIVPGTGLGSVITAVKRTGIGPALLEGKAKKRES